MRSLWLFFLVISLTSLGCKMAPAIPPDIARELAPIPITNRSMMTGSWANESFEMGPYRVSDVDRKAIISTGFKVAGGPVGSSYDDTTRKNSYSYTFTAPAGPSRGECSAAIGEQFFNSRVTFDHSAQGALGCRCSGAGLDAQTGLAGPGGAWSGQAMVHGWGMPMQAVDKYQNGMHSEHPLAIDVRAPDGRVLAAVELKHPGKVWFSPQLDAQSHAELACVFAGYLLFQDPKTMEGPPPMK
jgi:hypothetical protein